VKELEIHGASAKSRKPFMVSNLEDHNARRVSERCKKVITNKYQRIGSYVASVEYVMEMT